MRIRKALSALAVVGMVSVLLAGLTPVVAQSLSPGIHVAALPDRATQCRL